METPFTYGRSCYDLEMHSNKTGTAMVASCKLDEPRTVTEYKMQTDRRALGQKFKGDQKKVKCLRDVYQTCGCALPMARRSHGGLYATLASGQWRV